MKHMSKLALAALMSTTMLTGAALAESHVPEV